MSNYQKSEMLLNFAFEMTLKGHLKKADWAREKSRKYYEMGVKQ